MQRVLITGVAGMLGSHLLDRLVELNYQIVGTDNLAVGSIKNLTHNLSRSNFTFYQVDVLDYDEMKKVAGHADIVVHLAATKKIGEDGNGIQTLGVNTLGTEHCLRIALECGAKFILASTSDVYGNSPELPYAEDADLVIGPTMVKRWSYAVAKLYCEQLAFAYHKDFGIPVVVLRYFGGFSWRSSFSWSGGHIPIFIDQVLRGMPVTIHGDGLQTRSMAAVTDLVEGTYLAMTTDSAVGEIINIGNDEEMSVIDAARLVHRLANTGEELKVNYIPMEQLFGLYKDIQRRRPDLRKAKRLLGYQPQTNVEQFIEMTIRARRQQSEALAADSAAPK